MLTPNLKHPLFASLPVSIPGWRSFQPVVTFLRADHLLPAGQLAALVKDVLGVDDWDIGKANRETAGEDWVGWLEERVGNFTGDRGGTGGGRGWEGEKDGFLIWNTGAHWQRGKMPLKTEQQVHELQREMVRVSRFPLS